MALISTEDDTDAGCSFKASTEFTYTLKSTISWLHETFLSRNPSYQPWSFVMIQIDQIYLITRGNMLDHFL